MPATAPPRTAWEYHTISVEGELDPAQRAELEARGWTLYSVAGPVSDPWDRRRDHHFRRSPAANYFPGDTAGAGVPAPPMPDRTR